MTIDLRYILPFVAFYVPGAMLTFGFWLLGFPWHEARDLVAFLGGASGMITFGALVIWASGADPMLVRIVGKGGAE